MAIIWTTPRQWSVGEAVDDLKPQDISNNFDWLRNRQFVKNILVNTGSNIALAVAGQGSANWLAVNDTALGITIITTVPNQRVLITFRGWWSSSGAVASAMWFDALVDAIWASTGNTTGSATLGLGASVSNVAAAVVQDFIYVVPITIATPGTHVIKPRIGGTAGTTVTLYATTTLQQLDFAVLDL